MVIVNIHLTADYGGSAGTRKRYAASLRLPRLAQKETQIMKRTSENFRKPFMMHRDRNRHSELTARRSDFQKASAEAVSVGVQLEELYSNGGALQ